MVIIISCTQRTHCDYSLCPVSPAAMPLPKQPSDRHLASSSGHLHGGGGGPQVVVSLDRSSPAVVLPDQECADADLLCPSEMHDNSSLNTVALSISLDNLDVASSGDVHETIEGEREEGVPISHSFLAPKVSQDGDGMAAMCSISAPDLLTLSDNEVLKVEAQEEEEGGRSVACVNSQSTIPPSKILQRMSVEESIVEHRLLRQFESHLSEVAVDRREETAKESKKENTPDSMDGDFVVLPSPLPSPAPFSSSETLAITSLPSQLAKESAGDVTSSSVKVVKRQTSSGGYVKSHRRSLSSSFVDIMREARRNSKLEGREEGGVGHDRSNPSSSFVTILTPIDGPSKEDGSTLELGLSQNSADLSRKLELDEHSQADSMQTLDTSSHQGSDYSDEDDETDDQFSEMEPRTSLPMHHNGNSITSTGVNNIHNLQMVFHGVHSLSPVVLRRSGAGARRSANMRNRYSAEDLITNIDELNPESDDEGDGKATPTSPMLPRFPHWKINTPAPLHVIGQSDETDYADSTKAETMSSSSLKHVLLTTSDEMIKEETKDEVEKKMSISSSSSVFAKTVEEEVSLSDVDVSMVSDDPQRLHHSFNSSMERGVDRFYKQSGSPKTIRRRSGKPPTIQHKKSFVGSSSSNEESSNSTIKKGGLQKADVRPTIRHLKDLIIQQEELKDLLQNDRGATTGSLTRMRADSDMSGTGMGTAASGANLFKRSGSSMSDSVNFQHHSAQVVSSEEASGFQQRMSPIGSDSGSGTRSPLLATDLRFPEESSSLDYVPGSSMATRKFQQFQNTPQSPASPLSLSQTKSPPTTTSTHNTSSLVSSSASHTSDLIMPTSRLEEEEEEGRYERLNPIAVQDLKAAKSALSSSHRQVGKVGKSVSVYETCTEPSRFLFDPSKVFKDQEESGGKAIDKEQESSVKKLKSFFLGSKQSSKKFIKGVSTGKSLDIEGIQDGLPPSSSAAAHKQNRTKSTKFRKGNDNLADAVIPPLSPSIIRSSSVHVDCNTQLLERSGDSGCAGGDEASHLIHYNSSNTLTFPNKVDNRIRIGTIVEKIPECPNENQFNTDPTSLSDSSPPVPVVASPLPLPPPTSQGSGGESDNEESSSQCMTLATNHPELHLKEEVSWERTIDRRVYQKMNKAVREHQAILHELLHTEKQHFRALHVLKLIFRTGIDKLVSEDTLELLFPKLDDLIEISDGFIRSMEAKRDGILITDLSSVLLQQLSGSSFDSMLSAFGEFCSGHLNAMEIYKELLKKKNFARLMKDMHSLKECQRLELPDYYTKVTQRLPQLIILLTRLVKKTESLSLGHFPVIHQSLVLVRKLVAGVDQAVEDSKNLIEVMYIESRLEINVPKSAKVANRKDLKNLSLTAHNRKLRKRGVAVWMGHGRHLSKEWGGGGSGYVTERERRGDYGMLEGVCKVNECSGSENRRRRRRCRDGLWFRGEVMILSCQSGFSFGHSSLIMVEMVARNSHFHFSHFHFHIMSLEHYPM